MKEYSIAILGMGAVGGYIGGMLAAARQPHVKTVFIARAETLRAIMKNGLKLITEAGEITARPALASDDPNEIGPVDLLICSVKGYDLESSLATYKQCLTAGSIVLPLLNGIGIADKIRKTLPGMAVLEGLIYIVARQIGKGVIKQTGTLREIVFGSATTPAQDMQNIAAIFTLAGLKATVAENIDLELWKKFLFISVMGTLTSYYRSPIGEIRKDSAKAAHIPELLAELKAVAVARGVPITDQLAGAVLERISSLPAGTTTSMYADFQKGGLTEVEELTGDVVRLGRQSGVPTPGYQMMYKELKARQIYRRPESL